MKAYDFDYSLPKHLIAQSPVEPRSSSRLLVLDLRSGEIAHRGFVDIRDYLQSGDVLVLNDSRVVPAKITGKKNTGGKVELLLVKQVNGAWECLIKGRRLRNGTKMIFQEMEGTIVDNGKQGRFIVEFNRSIQDMLPGIGSMPLPPYIKMELKDQARYQTVYSKKDGSIASTTAGLHFTSELLSDLEERGVNIAFVTLHVGISTFLPVLDGVDLNQHKMEAEHLHIEEETARILNNSKGRIIAVGTTTVKALESGCVNGTIRSFDGLTDLFIYPGYRFRAKIDAMLTNFHLPRSTLLMLVSAYASKERIFRAYEEAIREHYRFYSFGDAMLIIK